MNMSRAWYLSLATTIVLGIATLMIYLRAQNPNLPSGYEGFFLWLAIVMLFGFLVLATVLSSAITILYAFGLYHLGLAVSVILALVTLLSVPGFPVLVLIFIPHIITGINGVEM